MEVALTVLTALAAVAMAMVALYTYRSDQRFRKWSMELRDPAPELVARTIKLSRHMSYSSNVYYEQGLVPFPKEGPGFRLSLLIANPGDVPLYGSGFSIHLRETDLAFDAFSWENSRIYVAPHALVKVQVDIAVKDSTAQILIQNCFANLDLILHYLTGAGSRCRTFKDLPYLCDLF